MILQIHLNITEYVLFIILYDQHVPIYRIIGENIRSFHPCAQTN